MIKRSQIKASYVSHMGSDLTPVQAARISFGRTSDLLSERDKKLMKYLADNEHMTPFEHQTLTVIIECPLYVRSQIHRHRTFSMNEISRRYSGEDLEFYLPPIEDIRKQSQSNKQASEGVIEQAEAEGALNLMQKICEDSLQAYERLLEMGVAREQARGILPQCLNTKFYMTGNLRNWVHFLRLRLHPHAQKEAREVALQIKQIIGSLWPESFKVLLKED